MEKTARMYTHRAAWAVVWLMGALVACDDKPEAPTQIEVALTITTIDEGGTPVPDVTFFVNGQKYGMTDSNGTHKTAYLAKPGEVISFDVEEPRGYRISTSQDRASWKCPPAAVGGAPCLVKIQFAVPEREYVLLVRGQKANEAVTLNGKKVGTTTASGSAILRVSGVPGSKFTAKVGDVKMTNAIFAATDEVYLIATSGVGPLGATKAPAVAEVIPEPVQEAVPASPKRKSKRAPRKARAARTKRKAKVAKKTGNDGDWWANSTSKARKRSTAGVTVGGGEPRRRPEPAPKPEPVREETVVAVAPTTPVNNEPASNTGNDNGDDLLGILDNPPEVIETPEPAAAAEPEAIVQPAASSGTTMAVGAAPSRMRAPKASEKLGAGLLPDDSAEVDRRAISKNVAIDGARRTSVNSMSKEEISERIAQIRAKLDRKTVIQVQDADFLQQVGRNHSDYYEANRLLGVWHYSNRDYKLTAKALEIATRKRRYKHDPTILLSLAKAYGRLKQFRKAIKVMRRVERKMNRLKVKDREGAFQFYGEMLELEFLRQHSDDPKKANMTLLSRSIRQLEKYINLAGNAGGRSVQKARATIKRLQTMKKDLEL